VQLGAVPGREARAGRHVVPAPVHRRRELGPARPRPVVGHLPPDLARAGPIGVQEGPAQRGGDHRLPALADVGRGGAHPVHDPNAIDALRVTVCLPFAGAGPARRRQRRDARFPRA
jgi:hypothetical protein